MRELVLILPDLFLASATDLARSSASTTALGSWRWSTPRLLRGGWRAMLARGVARPDLALVDEASVVDAALRTSLTAVTTPAACSGTDEIADAWLATPLHFVPGLTTLHFPANGLLRLETRESEELAREFDAVWGADGFALVPAGSLGFVLRGYAAPGVVTLDPARLIGAALEDSLPAGAGSGDLRALTSEIEMWLHDLPLNRERERRGAPRISSLWLWGGGQPPRDPIAITEQSVAQEGAPASRWSLLVSDDQWVQALASLAGVRAAALDGESFAGESINDLIDADIDSACVVAPLGARGVEAFESRFVAPAVAALVSGRLGSLALAANDRWVSLTAADRYKFWRMQRSFITAVADGGA